MRSMYILWILLFNLALCSTSMALRRESLLFPIYSKSQLAQELNQIVRATDTNIGIYVKSMKTGEMLYGHNVGGAFVPASTLKIMTAEAAFIYLGGNYRFATQVFSDSTSIRDGTLKANLYLVLNGDPTLSYKALTNLIKTLADKGVKRLQGNVYIDNTAFDQNGYGPGWVSKDKSACYGAPINAGIIDHNCIHFQMTPSTRYGGIAHIMPSTNYFVPAMRNEVVTKKRFARGCYLKISNDALNILAVRGCMPKGRYAWGVSYAISDVSEYNRALVKHLFRKVGILVKGNVSFGPVGKKSVLVSQHTSKPLSDIIHQMLKKSDNVLSGALFKKLGQLYTHRIGTWQTGSYAVTEILSKHLGLNRNRLKIADGSGVSRDNLTTPQHLMQVLEYAYNHQFANDFINALPIAGVDGTLKTRMGNIAGKIRAKTGTISGVVSLAGYTMNRPERVAFVIIINGRKGQHWKYKRLEDKIVEALIRYQA